MPSARPALNRDRVVAEAVALADEQGLAALSMRALAGRLGVEAMSLYHHVANKDALLDAMVDAVFGEMHLPGRRVAEWRAELRARSVSGRAVLTAPPVGRRADGLAAHARARRPCAPRRRARVPAPRRLPACAQTGTAFALLDAHLYGFMLQELSLPFEGEADLAALGAEILGPGGARRLPPLHRVRRGPRPAARVLRSATSSRSVSTSCSTRSHAAARGVGSHPCRLRSR